MEKRKKRARGSNWSHAHTRALAELKREASLNKEDGRLVWERIAQTLSNRFPGQIRTGDQCRRRWDTLVKVYNHIEDYCVVTGTQDHRELDKGELASMKLDSAYQQDWYDIVEQVCSQRKRKERCDRDLMLEKPSKGSLSVELPEHPPHRDTLCPASTSKSVTHHEQSTPESTTTYAQGSSSPSLEADKLGPEEKVPRLKNGNDALMLEQSTTAYAQVSSSPSLEVDKLSPEEKAPRLKNGNDGLGLEAMQLRQHGQTLESANLLPHTFPAENEAQLKEPLQDDLWDLVDAMPIETSVEIEQYGTEVELPDHSLWAWQPVHSRYARDESEYCSSDLSGPDLAAFSGHRAFRLGSRTSGVLEASRASIAANESRESNSLGFELFGRPAFFKAATMTSSTSSRSSDSTISRQSRRWSLKVILLNIRQCCHTCGPKKRTEDMEMESKQAARLKKKARKKALMSRKENVPAMLNAASSTSATRGDKPLQKEAERISKQAATDKKDEETMPRKAERQQLGGKSSSKCLPVGKLCAKWNRKLFPAFRDQSWH